MDIATSALIRKRAELAGEAEALDAKLAQLRTDLVHLDASIRLMCPDAEPELIRPKKPSRKGCDWFGRQELPRLILESLREAEQPLSALQLAQAAMVHKGTDTGDAIALKRVAGMVKGVLHRQEGRTVVKEESEWRTIVVQSASCRLLDKKHCAFQNTLYVSVSLDWNSLGQILFYQTRVA